MINSLDINYLVEILYEEYKKLTERVKTGNLNLSAINNKIRTEFDSEISKAFDIYILLTTLTNDN